jgi:hypothetical protein
MQTKTVSSKKAQEIKNAAIAIGVYGSGSKRLGDIAVTNKGLVWSNGNSKATKDITVKWDAFIGFMQAQLKTPVKAPAKKAPARKATSKARASASANGKKISAAKKAPVKKAASSKASRKKVH